MAGFYSDDNMGLESMSESVDLEVEALRPEGEADANEQGCALNISTNDADKTHSPGISSFLQRHIINKGQNTYANNSYSLS